MRHGPVAAAIERLLELHPDAHNARLDIDRVFGGGYDERTFNYKQHAFRLMAGNADIESGHTIIVSDLKITAQDEATLNIGVVYVSATNRLTDDLYDVRLFHGDDGTCGRSPAWCQPVTSTACWWRRVASQAARATYSLNGQTEPESSLHAPRRHA